jgi:hypothetical protein
MPPQAEKKVEVPAHVETAVAAADATPSERHVLPSSVASVLATDAAVPSSYWENLWAAIPGPVKVRGPHLQLLLSKLRSLHIRCRRWDGHWLSLALCAPVCLHAQSASEDTVVAYMRRMQAQFQDRLARGVIPVSDAHRAIAAYREVSACV